MFVDPQAMTVGTALSLPRTGSGLRQGTFQTADGNLSLSIQHQLNKKNNRRVFRTDWRKVAADPLVAAQNLNYEMSAYFVVQAPLVGFSIAEQIQLVTGMAGNLAATSNTNWTKFLGGES